MRPRLLLLLFLAATLQLRAQNLEKRIPKQATFVLAMNLGSLSTKINFNDLGNYNFLKKSEAESNVQPFDAIKELFRLPEKAGINRIGKLFIYAEAHDSINNISYLIAMSDVKAFENRMTDILKTRNYNPKFKKEGKLKVLIHDHKMSMSLGKDYALISIYTPAYYYNDDYYQYQEERNKITAIIDSTRYANMGVDTAVTMEYIPDTLLREDTDEQIPPPPDEEAIENIIISDTTVVIDEPYYDNSYDNDSLMKQFERRWVAKRKLKEEEFWAKEDKKIIHRIKSINDLKPADAMMSNPDFNKVISNKDDIIYWFDYRSYSDKLIELMSDRYSYKYSSDTALLKEKLIKQPPNTLIELLDKNIFYGIGNFEKGEIKMNFYNTFNDQLGSLIKKIYDKDINPEFFKYVKSDNLMGLIGMSIDTRALADLYYELFSRASESTAIPNKWALTYLELTDMFLDKNALHNTFKGDAVVAFTGIKSYLKTYSVYVYDSLTYQSSYVEKTKTEYIPEFVAVLTIVNKENITRILNLVKKLDGLKEVSPNIYSFRSRNSDLDGNFFIVIKDNLFFITNDKPLATEQIMNGMPTERTVGNAYNSYLNNSSFGFWDASKMFKLMAEGPEEEFGKPDRLEKLSEKINKGFFITTPITGNTANAEVTLEMKNRENSSLLELLNLFDEIYKR